MSPGAVAAALTPTTDNSSNTVSANAVARRAPTSVVRVPRLPRLASRAGQEPLHEFRTPLFFAGGISGSGEPGGSGFIRRIVSAIKQILDRPACAFVAASLVGRPVSCAAFSCSRILIDRDDLLDNLPHLVAWFEIFEFVVHSQRIDALEFPASVFLRASTFGFGTFAMDPSDLAASNAGIRQGERGP